MVCIYCESSTQVINSRQQKRLNQVWRRRRCINCGNTFTSHEGVDLSASIVIRNNASHELKPFEKDILFISIYESCKHHPAAIQDAAALTQTAITRIRQELSGGVVARDTIVKSVMATLKPFDATAATIYQAYHPLTMDVVKRNEE